MNNEIKFCYVDADDVITSIGKAFIVNKDAIFDNEPSARLLLEGEPELGDHLVDGVVVKTVPMSVQAPPMLEVGQPLEVSGLPDGAVVTPPLPPTMNEAGAFTYHVKAPGYRPHAFSVVVVPASFVPISDRQFGAQLVAEGIITREEALAFVQQGATPAALQTIVDGVSDPEARFQATMLISGATEFRRDHPLVEVVRSALGWTSEHLDAFWRAAAQR